MSNRPSKVRNTITRKLNKLAREKDYRIDLYTSEQMDLAKKDYYSILENSWKAKEQHKEIIDGLIDSYAVKGWLRLAIIYIQGKPAATQLWFVVHEKAYIFRLAYDQQWKQYSPGSILTRYLMKYVIDIDKVTEIDFLTGNEQYKQDWMTQRQSRYEIVLANQQTKNNTSELIAKIKKIFTSG